MNGIAFRCDWCKKVEFVSQSFSDLVIRPDSSWVPPEEWLMLYEVDNRAEGTNRVAVHLCSYECLHYYTSHKLGYEHD